MYTIVLQKIWEPAKSPKQNHTTNLTNHIFCVPTGKNSTIHPHFKLSMKISLQLTLMHD